MRFSNYKDLFSSFLAYETVLNAAYRDEIMRLWRLFMISWCSRCHALIWYLSEQPLLSKGMTWNITLHMRRWREVSYLASQKFRLTLAFAQLLKQFRLRPATSRC